MATRRRSLRPNLNFRPSKPDITRAEARGTRPTAPPTTIKEIFIDLVMHLGKKTLFFDTNLKVALYLGALIIISAVGDTIPLPRSYLARSDNLFNRYFVKIGWGWTLLLLLPYVAMTSYTLCCGNFKKMMQRNLVRILIATVMWLLWTKFFNYVEYFYGRCSVKSFATKSSCLKAGHLWKGFDISGHAFILIHSSLVLIEESRPIIKWDTIREHLRNEFYNRSPAGRDSPNSEINPLRNLGDTELRHLRFLYERFTPVIRILFIAISALQLLWDVMLVCTMLYFHRMVEKFVSGVIAILVWYFTYRFWYPSVVLPDAPGTGNFIYQPKKVETAPIPARRQPPTNAQAATDYNIPKFMGMPLYTNPRQSAATTSNGVATSQNLEMSS